MPTSVTNLQLVYTDNCERNKKTSIGGCSSQVVLMFFVSMQTTQSCFLRQVFCQLTGKFHVSNVTFFIMSKNISLFLLVFSLLFIFIVHLLTCYSIGSFHLRSPTKIHFLT